MPLMIDLSPAQEERLEAAARQRGLVAADLVRQLLAEHLPAADETSIKAASHPTTAQEIVRALDELAEMNRDLPVLPPEAFERESIYRDLP